MLKGLINNSNKIKLYWLYRMLNGHRVQLFSLIVFNIFLGCIFSFNALLLKEMLGSASKHNYNMLYLCVAIFVVVAIAQIFLEAISDFFKSLLSNNFSSKLRHVIFAKIFSLNYLCIKNFHTSIIYTKLTYEVDVIAKNVMEIIPTISNALAQIISIEIALIILTPKLGCTICFLGVLILLFNYFANKKLSKIKVKNNKAKEEQNAFIQESLLNFVLIKGLGLKRFILKKANKITKNNKKNTLTRIKYNFILNIIIGLSFKIFYIAIIIISLTSLVQGTFNIGTFSALILLSTRIQHPFRVLVNVIQSISYVLNTLNELIKMVEQKHEMYTEPHNRFRTQHSQNEVLAKYNNANFSILMTDASFSYYNTDNTIQKNIFCNVYLKLEKNKMYGITGKSGIGKTTFFYILMHILYRNRGYIEIGENSLNQATQCLFSYVPQNSCLFSGTIRSSLTFFNESISDEQIWEALRLACADKFVTELPEKLDYIIGENGNTLSFGQCQRLAIARAILYDKPIMLLDEACSGVDKNVELNILKNLKTLNKTILAISHRNSILQVCDDELEIKDKKIFIKKKVI